MSQLLQVYQLCRAGSFLRESYLYVALVVLPCYAVAPSNVHGHNGVLHIIVVGNHLVVLAQLIVSNPDVPAPQYGRLILMIVGDGYKGIALVHLVLIDFELQIETVLLATRQLQIAKQSLYVLPYNLAFLFVAVSVGTVNPWVGYGGVVVLYKSRQSNTSSFS